MRPLPFLILLLFVPGLARGGTAARGALEDAVAARSLLGGETWSRIVRIDSSRPGAIWKRGPYPRTVYALVFELSGILWFYTDVDGTQSLSLTRGTVARDKANPGPLFAAIDPGFTTWAWFEPPAARRGPAATKPRNACFLESVAALGARIDAGGEAGSPQLLSYYVDTPQGRLGHTVLVFSTSAGLAAIDPDASPRPVPVPSDLGADPKALSAFLRGGPVAAARTLPLGGPRRAPGEWATLPPAAAPAG